MRTRTIQNNTNLAIIPARGGSKGIPRKCLAHVGGKPILQRAIEHAIGSHAIQRTIVSTDDQEFADLSIQWGAEVPFLRPESLAGDHSSTIDVVLHLLDNLAEKVLPEFIVLIQPTTPLLLSEDLDLAFAEFKEGLDAVVSVCESEVNPDWLRRLNGQGWLEPVMCLDVPQHTPRQQMPLTYRLNGAFFMCRTRVFLENKTFLPERTVPFVMPVERSADIDCEHDLFVSNCLAERILGEVSCVETRRPGVSVS